MKKIYILKKSLQFNSKKDFFKSNEYKKMRLNNEIFDTEIFKDFVIIRIWEEKI